MCLCYILFKEIKLRSVSKANFTVILLLPCISMKEVMTNNCL